MKLDCTCSIYNLNLFCLPHSDARSTLYRDSPSERGKNYEYLYEDQLTPSFRRAKGKGYRNQRRRRRNRNRRRRKNRPTQSRQGGLKTCGPAGSQGVCRNFMSCMLSGRRLDFQADQGRNCDELFSVCCTIWPSTFSGPSIPRKKRQRHRYHSNKHTKNVYIFNP